MAKKEPQKPERKFPRFRVQFDISYKGTSGKKATAASQTMPDMNLTVRQMLDNYTRTGETGAIEHQPMYFETEIPTFDDMVDVQTYKEHLHQQMKLADEFIRNQQEEQSTIPADELDDALEERSN